MKRSSRWDAAYSEKIAGRCKLSGNPAESALEPYGT